MRERVATYLPQLILLANAGAFAVLLAELLIMGHTDGIQRLAPATAAVGMALCVFAALLPARLRLAPAVFLLALSVTGLIGFAQHVDEREDGLAGLFQSSDDDDRDDNSGRGNSDDRDDDDDDDDEEPPPLAPLGLSGTALLSAIAALAVRRES